MLFSLIAAEESSLPYPSFGTSTAPYLSSPAQSTDIRQFYSAWINFATEKEFAWKDSYRFEEGMDRRMKRQIEMENKKDRAQGKREYNECVRVSASPSSLNLILTNEKGIGPIYSPKRSTLDPLSINSLTSSAPRSRTSATQSRFPSRRYRKSKRTRTRSGFLQSSSLARYPHDEWEGRRRGFVGGEERGGGC